MGKIEDALWTAFTNNSPGGDSGNYILWRGRLLHAAIILYLVAVVKGKKRGSPPCVRPLKWWGSLAIDIISGAF